MIFYPRKIFFIFQIVTKKLGDKFYKTKGMVKKLIDEYTANVKLDDGNKSKNSNKI